MISYIGWINFIPAILHKILTGVYIMYQHLHPNWMEEGRFFHAGFVIRREMEWESFFDDLKNRVLNGFELVISDGHRGIQESVTRSFLGALWHYCHVHFMRNLMKLIQKKKLSVMQIVKQALENESLVPKAQELLVNEELNKASDMFETLYNSLYNYKAYSESIQRRLRTTNVLERLNLGFKRRTKKIGAFPSEQSLHLNIWVS